MKYRLLAGTDLNISTLCLGTMTFGEQNSEAEAHEQLDYAQAAGINFIDTAEMYPVPGKAETQGLTESYVGTWLAKQSRDKIILASKISGPNRGMDWIRGGPKLNREQIISACNASLKRLRTDYLDLYQLHWPARHVPMFGQSYYDPSQEPDHTPDFAEQLAALNELVIAGKVRHIGLSNETPWGVMEANRVAKAQSLPRIASIQNVFNLINRNFENGLVETCHRENVGLLAYSPLAFGLLSGKYLDNPHAAGRMTRYSNFGARYLKPAVPPAIAAYVQLSREHGLSPAQMALAWVSSRWYVASNIIGATTMAQLKENIASLDVLITPELDAAIEAIHKQSPNPAN